MGGNACVHHYGGGGYLNFLIIFRLGFLKEQDGVQVYKNWKFQRTSWVQVFQMLMRGTYEVGLGFGYV